MIKSDQLLVRARWQQVATGGNRWQQVATGGNVVLG